MAIRCDVCGQPACVHITEINSGVTVSRGLCEAHALTIAGIPPGTMFPVDELTRSGGEYIAFFLWLREEFILTGTIPTAEEMLATGRVPETSAALLEDERMADSYWRRLKAMAAGSNEMV
jgi:hypothetical protein